MTKRTTEFNAFLEFETPISEETIDALRQASNGHNVHGTWLVSTDFTSVYWDGSATFSNEDWDLFWLQSLVDTVLKPRGLKVTGHLSWNGEEPFDVGAVVVSGFEVGRISLVA